MDTIFAIVFLLTPICIFAVKSQHDYNQNLEEIFSRWTLIRILCVFYLIFYVLFIANVGAFDIVDNFFEYFEYFAFPGVAISLIIFSKSASEIIHNHSKMAKVGVAEGMAVFLGCIYLIYFNIILSLEWSL